MFELGDSLTVQFGPIAGRAEGPLAILTLLAMTALYVFGTSFAFRIPMPLSRGLRCGPLA